MDKKNYNIEIFFESQKKSFVILSKNKVTLEEVKSRTIKEFNIPNEYEKDMRFFITINNRLITISNDFQIMKNFEEMSKNNFYLKINFAINNKNYIYQVPNNRINNNKYKKQKIEVNEQFSIISHTYNKKENNKYIEEINKLKNEIQQLKEEKNIKPEFDIRKFDEKFRDLNNKNNDLKQKIFELENENKTLKINQSKNTLEIVNNSDDIKSSDNSLIKKMEKVFKKLINEHDKKMIQEISDIKNKIDIIFEAQNIKNDKNKIGKKENNNNFELLNEDIDIEKNIFDEKDENIKDKFDKINKDIINYEKNDNNTFKSKNIINEKENSNVNLNNSDNNSEDLKNLENIFNEKKIESNNIIQKNNNDSIYEKPKEGDSYLEQKIKRNINFYEEENEKNSKSFDNSIKLKYNIKKDEENTFKEIKNSFLETNPNDHIHNYFFKNTEKSYIESYSKNKNTIPKSLKAPEKTSKKIKKQNSIYNNNNTSNTTNINKTNKISNLSDEDIINYESSSDINSDLKNNKNINQVNIKKYKNIKLKKEKNRNINKINKFLLNEETPTPFSEAYITSRKKQNNSINPKEGEKYSSYTTPNVKNSSIKEDIENYFINVFQSIFFYGNNGYVNMLNISEKLLQKLTDGLIKYRNDLKEVKNCSIRYISYSIIPIINDINTKEYQRRILKDKIKKILEYLSMNTNYFDKEYKVIPDNKNEKRSEKKNFNRMNITHAKINEFRKCYDLKAEDYSDEMLIKALIRYRGNKEMAFQYLFY